MSEARSEARSPLGEGKLGYTIHDVTGEDGMSSDVQFWLKDNLVRAFPDLRMEEYFAAKPDWFEGFDHLVYATESDTGDAVGVLAARWRALDGESESAGKSGLFLHATTQFIAPRWQGSGMLLEIWRRFLALTTHGPRGFPELIVLKTCHPAAFRPMVLFADVDGIEVYPRLSGLPQDKEMARLACSIVDEICPDKSFDSESGVIKDVSTPRDFYAQLPAEKRVSEVGEYFYHHLTPNDRVLCIIQINTAHARAAILRAFRVPLTST